MKKKLIILSVSAAISVCSAQFASAAEIWSDGDWQLGQPANVEDSSKQSTPYTEIWSEPIETPIWTEPVETPIWSEPTDTEIWSEPVQTQLNLTFTIKPILQNGSVFVPLRGTLEQLGFSLEWSTKEQLAKIIKGDTTIYLKANSNVASVNGAKVTLTSPAKIMNGSVYVPLRFISTATGSNVEWDAKTTKVTIDDKYYFYVNQSKQQQQETNQQSQTDSSFYVGIWKLWIPGGYATIDSTTNNDGSTTKTQQYMSGAGGHLLTIKADGTYTWDAVGGIVNGSWKTADNGRILLPNGEHGYDWYVEKISDNEIKISAGYGLYTEGTRVK